MNETNKSTNRKEYSESFRRFFQSPAAILAAQGLNSSASIAFKVLESDSTLSRENWAIQEEFWFVKREGKNDLIPPEASEPDFSFFLPTSAADEILKNPEPQKEEIGQLGVEIGKLIVHPNAHSRIIVKMHCGVFTVIKKGYLSIFKSGGKEFAQFLAGRGFSGITAFKKIFETLRKKS